MKLDLYFATVCRFQDKTRNDWANRKKFIKVPGKYDLLEMDYSIQVRLHHFSLNSRKDAHFVAGFVI